MRKHKFPEPIRPETLAALVYELKGLIAQLHKIIDTSKLIDLTPTIH